VGCRFDGQDAGLCAECRTRLFGGASAASLQGLTRIDNPANYSSTSPIKGDTRTYYRCGSCGEIWGYVTNDNPRSIGSYLYLLKF
jgi:hypothetical protein